ncbi:MAG: RNA methyltransferase [Clostridia bacterium]|nr:RNA methyltransferase [Clostridia bacterium]
MARIIVSPDPSSEELALYKGLTARQEIRQDVFIAESVKVIDFALDAGLEPVSLLMERRHLEGKAAHLIERTGGVPVYAPPDEWIHSLTGYALHRGVLCAMKRPSPASPETVLPGAGRVAVLENIADEANLGAIFRSGAALGMDALLLSPGCADALSRKCVRVSMGAVFRLPWARTEELDEGGIGVIRRFGFTPCALALTDESMPVTRMPARKPALILGNEGTGLKAATVAACDVTLKIPMKRGMDSLNVAAAAAVAFWEAGRAGAEQK